MQTLDSLRKKLGLESTEYYRKKSLELEREKAKARDNLKKYTNEYEINNKQLEELRNKSFSEKQQLGIKTGKELGDQTISSLLNTNYYLPSNSVSNNLSKNYTQRVFEKTKEDTRTNLDKINQYRNSDTYKQLEKLKNENLWTKYKKEEAEVNNQEISFLDKINLLNQYNVGLNEATATKNYTNEKGYKISLPSKNQLKADKAMEESNFFLRGLQSATRSLGSMTPAMIANMTGVPYLSEAVTWATTFNSATNEKLLEGYDKEKAQKYGVINATLEAGLGSMLGGASKIITGKDSILSRNIGKLANKIFKNEGLSYFLSHTSSELIEEELQTILDPINEHVTLGDYKNLSEALSTISLDDIALTAYSTLLTMGITEGPTSLKMSKMQKNIDKINKEYGTDFKLKVNDNSIDVTDNSLAEYTSNTKIDKEKLVEANNKVNNEINNVDNINSNITKDDTTNITNKIDNQITQVESQLETQQITSEVATKTLNELKNDLNTLKNWQETQKIIENNTINKEQVKIIENLVNKVENLENTINNKINLPTANSNTKIDISKINPEILEDIKQFQTSDTYVESFKGDYIKEMLNESGIKIPVAMNYVTEITPNMEIRTTKSLTKQQYASINNALLKLKNIDTTSINNINYSIPIGNYQYVKSSNANINELRRTASMYLNNTARSNNTIRLLENIIKDKSYTIRFNPNINNEQGTSVNGLITKENGKTIIELNPNADNYVEFLVIHEITHDIATSEMKKLILDYAKQDPEFEKSLESIKERYKTNDVSDEVVADVCGELFGNREFIQSVVEKKPNIFKKILNNIRKLAEKIKGTGANEYVSFVEKLKNMWEEAYYSNTSNLSKTMYHLSENALNEVNDALNNPNTDINSMVKLRDFTPEQLVSVGVSDLPMLVRKGHLRENILTSSEAENKGYSTKGKHYHGLGIETYMNAIDSLDNPIAVYQYTDKGNYPKDNFIVLTEVKDSDNNNIIVPIEIHKKGQYNKIEIDTNRIKTTYGRETTNYFNNMIENDNLVEIYNKKRNTKLPMQSGNFNVSYANKIPQSNNNVNSDKSSTTKYSIPINKNNAQELENSSFLLKNSEGNDIDITNLKENDSMLRMHYKRVYDKNTVKAYRGVSENTGSNGAFYGLGLYTTLDKNYAKKYGEVFEVDNDLLPNNPLMFKTQNDFQIWEQLLAQELNIRKSKLYSNNYGVEQYIKRLGYDGLMIGSGKDTDLISFKDVPKKYSQNTKEWNEYLKENFPSTGTKTKMSDIKLPIREDIKNGPKKSSILNPNEISKLTKDDANTTPILPKRGSINKVNDGNSHFAKNIENKVNMLNEEQKTKILSNADVKYYDKVTNKESLEKAFKKINDGGSSETLRWVKQDSKNANATDVAEGWILLKQYADNGDYDSMVEVAKKMREIGTTAGQTVQAFNIMERMTPEGMVKYAQSELSEAYDKMVKNKSKEWMDKYREDFDLKPDEVKFIMDTMQEVQNMEDGYDKRVKLAEIQKLMTDKLPPEKGTKVKSWMRISMLFNPKTQVRNVAGNALIMPINSFSDLFSSYADKLIAKKTGIRTTGTTNVKAMLKGIKKGAYEATNDYKKGINTKDMEGNRFEISNGKSFSENNLIGKTLNRTESLLNYVMDVGDRVFSEASFENSLQNQLVLNNTTNITQEMIDIAHQEALSRTWNDNNNYTRFVLGVRKGLNKLNVNGYGLGDVLIPFAKTPANLTKAIVDYSPAGLVSTINKGINLKKSLTNGQYTSTIQHEFVQSLGKATAGTMLYILGIALAKAGITSGESDDDKDTANFLKNTLGISSYSIKIGNKSFTYDWAQPLAAPLSITANMVSSKGSDSKALLEGIVGSLDSAGSILLEQSFLQSISDVLNDNDGVVSGIINEVLELPARAVPTFSKQIADLVDSTQRTSFEYGKPVQSAINSIKVKIPFVSKTLSPSVDTLGREIQKYGGKNNIFNVFLNPANVNTENISKSAEEIYRLYKKTGNQTIMPRVAPYYINKNGEKITMTSKERADYQKISGEIIEESVNKLLKSKDYQQLNDNEKAEIINKIVNYSYNKARKKVLNIEMSSEYDKISSYINDGGNVGDYYLNKKEIDYSYNNPEKYKVINQVTSYNKYLSYKKEIDTIKEKYTNSSQRKAEVIKYVNSLKLTIPQKAILIRMNYSSYNDYNNQIINYINKQSISLDEKKEILENLGFKIKNGRVY